MKKERIRRLAALLLAFLYVVPAQALSLPDASETLSLPLAKEALALCTGHTEDATRAAFLASGLTVLSQVNYDKPDDDASHTCAYTVGKTEITLNGEARALYAVAVRGTNAGEWYANFDFAPSRDANTRFAENFLFAAQDVFLALKSLIAEDDAPLFLLMGHSRGAACANLLALLLSAEYGQDAVYAYTFATPATLRYADALADLPNVFNFLNPADVVPKVPLKAWGYRRVGRDILLPGDGELGAAEERALDTLYALAPDIASYYETEHAVASGAGLTTYGAMLAVASALTGLGTGDMGAASEGADTDALLEALSDTDFAPLAELLKKVAADDFALGKRILNQHMPETYRALLEQMTDEQE